MSLLERDVECRLTLSILFTIVDYGGSQPIMRGDIPSPHDSFHQPTSAPEVRPAFIGKTCEVMSA